MIASNEVRARGRALEVAAFEASMLVRCTGAPGHGGRRPGGPAGIRRTGCGPLAEFNRSGPADRLAELLGAIGRLARVHRYTAGTRHRYEISQVFTDDDTVALLDRTWRQGFLDICGDAGSRCPARHAQMLAEAAWRAMMLVSGPARANAPGVHVSDLDTGRMLVRAGRTLRMPVRMSSRPGGQLLLVMAGDGS